MDHPTSNRFSGFLPSPIGLIEITSNCDSITSIIFRDEGYPIQNTNINQLIVNCISQLNEYFEGTRHSFDLPTNPSGTEFQNRVWEKVCKIPFGETTSYGKIAKALGDTKLNRAVGFANGANPIPIIIPCHRVIGGDGSLTGYAGGLDKKSWLLRHERHYYTPTKGQLRMF